MTISERCVNKPTTTVLVLLMAVLLGIFCVFKLPVDMYPDMDLPYLIVITNYKGAGPEEVEQSVTRTLEGQLSGLSGLKTLHSRSISGTSFIILEMNYGANLDASVNEIRDKIMPINKVMVLKSIPLKACACVKTPAKIITQAPSKATTARFIFSLNKIT